MDDPMSVRTFNTNTAGHLATVFDTGGPRRVRRGGQRYVAVLREDLLDDLVNALGDRAQAIFAAHREQAADRARAAAATDRALDGAA